MLERHILDGFTVQETQEIMEAFEHNLRLAGESNYPFPMHRFRFVPHQHFIFKNAKDLQFYEAVRCFSSGQYLVKRLWEKSFPEHLRSRNKIDVWESDQPVILPSSQEIEKLDLHPKTPRFNFIRDKFK